MEEEKHHEEELTIEDVVEENDIILDALIELLIEKKIITEQDLNKKIESLGEESS